MLRDEIRNELFEYLEKRPSTQISEITHHFEQKHGRAQLLQDGKIIYEIVSEMISNNILMPGTGNPNNVSQFYPFITLTEYGKTVLDSKSVLPYDPDSYIKEIKNSILYIDDILLTYLSEAKTTYNRELLLSSTITLGVASERLILILIDVFIKSISDHAKQRRIIKEMNNKFFLAKYTIFRKYFDPIKSALPKEIADKLNIYLESVFNFIRENRNEAGHPTGVSMNKKELFAYLQIFGDYAMKIYSLIDYLNNNRIQI
jgi:hypothetical protein